MPASMIHRCQRLFLVLFSGLLVTACATTTPSIPPYTGQDSVGAVNAEMFVGSWSVRVLNPVEGQSDTAGLAVFKQDGSLMVNSEDKTSGLDLKLQMIGSWSVSGELLQTQLDSVEETSGNALGSMMAGLMTSMKDRMSGEANVYEMTTDRFIVVGKEGQAYEYTRQ